MENNLSDLIIKLEKTALERWNNGDPSGFLEISANDVVYFDPFLEKRLNGHKALTELYESLRGKVKADSYDMIEPLVQGSDNMAVLTFNLLSVAGSMQMKWNCTEVYRKENNDEWKIIQTHWSITKPDLSI